MQEVELNPAILTEADFSDWFKTFDKMEGKRCISCGRLVGKKYWRLPDKDVNGCGVRPLCKECS
ncbi:MAG: hypothetical protein M0R32_11100 [Candidatus Cloacimonetes bacterium]|nr:hypothetical protein [Candidatus Cloacimonadota bacterium]